MRLNISINNSEKEKSSTKQKKKNEIEIKVVESVYPTHENNRETKINQSGLVKSDLKKPNISEK